MQEVVRVLSPGPLGRVSHDSAASKADHYIELQQSPRSEDFMQGKPAKYWDSAERQRAQRAILEAQKRSRQLGNSDASQKHP